MYEQLLLQSIRNAVDSFIVVNEQQEVVYVNEGALNTYGYSPKEFDRLPLDKLIRKNSLTGIVITSKDLPDRPSRKGRWHPEKY